MTLREFFHGFFYTRLRVIFTRYCVFIETELCTVYIYFHAFFRCSSARNWTLSLPRNWAFSSARSFARDYACSFTIFPMMAVVSSQIPRPSSVGFLRDVAPLSPGKGFDRTRVDFAVYSKDEILCVISREPRNTRCVITSLQVHVQIDGDGVHRFWVDGIAIMLLIGFFTNFYK